MSRMAVIYWSMTGNTEAMANAIAEGAAGAGACLGCSWHGSPKRLVKR